MINVVSVGAAHAEVMAEIHAASFPPGEIWSAPEIAALFSVPGTLACLAMQDEQPLGFVLARQSFDEAEILTLAVMPSARRQGIAGAFLTELCNELRKRDVERLFLEVSAHNHGARALYANRGFVSCGVRRAYYADGSDALVLSSDLRTRR